MIFRRTLRVPEGWDAGAEERAVAFWQGRGFRFEDAPRGGSRVGRRGSLWGNLTSFDMGRLMATMTITSVSPTEAEFVMEVNTAWQIIPEWDRMYWLFELEAAGSWVLRGDAREEEWRAFERWQRDTAWRSVLSGWRGGNRRG